MPEVLHCSQLTALCLKVPDMTLIYRFKFLMPAENQAHKMLFPEDLPSWNASLLIFLRNPQLPVCPKGEQKEQANSKIMSSIILS